MNHVLKGIAISTVVKVVIGIVVIAVALFFFTGLINLWLPIGGGEHDIALSSVEALRCAVDLTATQLLSVPSCNGGAIGNVRTLSAKEEAEQAALSIVSGQNQKSGCTRLDKDGKPARFSCRAEGSTVSKDVECGQDGSGKWSCTAKEFELPQKEFLRDAFKSIIPGVVTLTDFANKWIGAIGQPRYVVSYEYFPSENRALWTYENKELTSVVASVAVGGLLNLAPGGGIKASLTKEAVVGGLKNIPKGIVAIFKKETYVGLKGRLADAIVERVAGKAGTKGVEELAASRVVSAYVATEGLEDIVGKNVVKVIIGKDGVKKFTEDVVSSVINKLPQDSANRVYLESTLRSKMDYFWNEIFEKYVKACRDFGPDCTLDDDFIKNEMATFIKNSDLGIPEAAADSVINEIPSMASLKLATDDVKEVSRNFFKGSGLLDSLTQQELREQLQNELTDVAREQLIQKSFVEGITKYRNIKDFEKLGNLFTQLDDKAGRISQIAYKDIVTKLHTAEAHSGLSVREQFVGRIEKSLRIDEQKLELSGDTATLLGLDQGTADAAKQIFKAVAKDKAPTLLKGVLGLPADAELGSYAKRVALMSVVYIVTYKSLIDENNENLHKTCGGNSLCLNLPTVTSENEKFSYQFPLAKSPSIFVSSRIPEIVGESFVQAYAVSPCKANVKVTLGTEQQCKDQFYSSDKIYYSVNILHCNGHTKSGINLGLASSPTGDPLTRGALDFKICLIEKDREEYLKSIGQPLSGDETPSFGEELISSSPPYSLTLEDCNSKYLTNDIVQCANDDSLDKIEMLKGNLRAAYTSYPDTYQEILRKVIFRAFPINVQKDVNGNLVPVSTCTNPDFFSSITGLNKVNVNTVSLKFDDIGQFKDKDKLDPNYCRPSHAKWSDWAKVGCQVGVIGGSLIATFFTGGTASYVALYAIGSSGVACDHILDTQAARWPNTQE